MAVVYILSHDGKPLMPTTRCGHVRWLLKNKKARIVERNPFTIQLLYETEYKTQDLTLGIDPGRTNIGLSVVDANGKEVFSAEVISRNKDVTENMKERKVHRQASRRGRRLRRQRRAVKNNTVFDTPTRERYLPKYEKPITIKFIKNKEARFCNRTRPGGWLTPTANHCVETHVNLMNKIAKFLPITRVSIEVNVFDFQLMENPHIKDWQYSKGKLFGYADIYEYISEHQDGRCLLCGGKIEHYHHIVPRSQNGSNCFENLVGLCFRCHTAVHTDKEASDRLKALKEGMSKKYAGSSVLNTAMPYIIEKLSGYELWLTTGRETKIYRNTNGIDKTHSNDAYCIACSSLEGSCNLLSDKTYKIKQYRRHDRACVHKTNCSRKYYLDGKLVAANRHKAMEQKEDSLEEYRNKLVAQLGQEETTKIISRLTVKEHKPAYKNPNRIMPGAFMTAEGRLFTLKGTSGSHNGVPDGYASEQGNKFGRRKCQLIKFNTGLVFVQDEA